MNNTIENSVYDPPSKPGAFLPNDPPTSASTVPGADVTPAGRIPVLDGLRGIAILSVMAFHFWMFGTTVGITFSERVYNSIASKGWVGVDLFFVLSGFLITGILYDSRQDPHYYRVFYARRTVRIFPLYYASLALFFFIIPFLLRSIHPLESVNVHEGATAKLFAWSYLLNWYEGLKGFSVVPPPLQHFWSLAIEEQFYLVWPFLVLTLARRRLMWLCMGLMVLAFALRVALYRIHLPEAAFMWTFCRTDSLAIGAMVALAARDVRDWKTVLKWAPRLTLPALFAILALMKLRILSPESGSEHFLIRSFAFSMLGIVFGGCLAMASCLRDGSYAHRFLGSPFLRFFGKYSYCLYVCHQPIVLHFAKIGLHTDKLAATMPHKFLAIATVNGISFAASIAIALLSWHLFEKHWLKLKDIPFFQHASMGAGGK